MNLLYDKVIEYYEAFKENLPIVIISFLVLILGFFISTIVKKMVYNLIKNRNENFLSGLFISQIIGGVINVIAFILFLDIIGFSNLTTKILTGAGILTFVIGFAFKDIGENFLAGILLAFKSPFKINDLIESASIIGYVKELNIRETTVKTTDGKDVFIPNSQIIKNPLINYTIDGFLRYEFMIGIDYGADVNKAIQIVISAVSNTKGVLNNVDKKPAVNIEVFGSSSINLKVFFWLDTFESSSKLYHSGVRTEVMKNVLKKLTENGFYLPGDIIEIKQYQNGID
jgi:small conductance mechanosensitive channel